MQFVKYRWETSGLSGEPFLFARENKDVSKVKLLDESVHMTLFEKTCVGYTKKGRHHECPKKREVSEEKMCHECMLNDDFFMCVKCDGSECINELQRSNCIKGKYYIYLAAFSTVLKVGISQEHRILERLIEQGADMGAKIGLVRDGKIARELEQSVKKELNITDRLRGVEKQKLLFSNQNAAAVSLFNAFARLRVNGFREHLIGPEIYNLQNIYHISSVSETPSVFRPEYNSVIEGRVVAAKGNLVVVKNSDGFLSFDANKLIGHRAELDVFAG